MRAASFVAPTPDASDVTGKSYGAIARELNRDEIPSPRIGSRYKFKLEQLVNVSATHAPSLISDDNGEPPSRRSRSTAIGGTSW